MMHAWCTLNQFGRGKVVNSQKWIFSQHIFSTTFKVIKQMQDSFSVAGQVKEKEIQETIQVCTSSGPAYYAKISVISF